MHQSTRKPSKSGSGRVGQVRIIGGRWKGRRIKFMESAGLRPTLDRVRETLFNWLMYDIEGARCLDLFAGSAALGIEALSRGAKEVVFVEKNRKASDNIHNNLRELEFSNARVFNTSAEVVAKKNEQPYNIIFIDPPFYQEYLDNILVLINNSRFVQQGTQIYVERERHSDPVSFPDNWELTKEKQVGGLEFYLLEVTQLPTEGEEA
ncbi:16S rRNA (guanine(966)-N(2))-methyltransferase RsmD [Pleionea sp. CnH1-48]|uniref:16S rRNA (guanine(966)-N(2))-methyltransferase RsmD n=1 Tax=Pleionea sp. CnH1-48 TaxID=2954494 RepID=UPI00209701BA|nr:16S rRNA (guanine(966)-N(2))-methyltransferase RsmD [Pleionea sp. CnH1-48]MCO7226533.1 16S rRNA (guanine(966)-N(2))-methyltransferase RsmD [Pleionea sp. CnH1-48]